MRFFIILSIDDSAKEGDCLNYGQKFLICTLPGIGGDVSILFWPSNVLILKEKLTKC